MTEHTAHVETPRLVLDVEVTGQPRMVGLVTIHVKRIEKDKVLVASPGSSEPIWLMKDDVLKIIINADVEVPT